MAKTNIFFNNKNYSIPDESLSAASAALRTHLSTVMNGTSATITLGGTAYSIDSTKLSAATSDFTSYLRTVAGTGYKVNVGGVEYGVGADKVSGAVAELENVLGGLNSDDGSTHLPDMGLTVEEYTWEEIKAISEAGKADEYFNLGDIKTMTLTDGNIVKMQIVAFSADEKADGSGSAGITWISKEVGIKHRMNSTSTNFNGWAVSEMRDWLQSDFYTTMPSNVLDAIVSVNKTYYDYTTSSTLTIKDNIWIPSYREVFGNSSNIDNYETSGADYTAFFIDDASRKKPDPTDPWGMNGAWWTRSAVSNFDNGFQCVGSNGKIGEYNGATNNKGVAIGFCI